MSSFIAQQLFSLLITVLQELGVLTAAEAGAVKAYDSMDRFVEHLKKYQEFPTGKNGATEGTDNDKP